MVDHSQEVELRVKAIMIRSSDSCGFFTLREGALLMNRECRNCAFGCFKEENGKITEKGLCKYKAGIRNHEKQIAR